jgi:hypothetical protein
MKMLLFPYMQIHVQIFVEDESGRGEAEISIPKGLFDICHYNFRISEIYHFNSSIQKYAITIQRLFEMCHFVRI